MTTQSHQPSTPEREALLAIKKRIAESEFEPEEDRNEWADGNFMGWEHGFWDGVRALREVQASRALPIGESDLVKLIDSIAIIHHEYGENLYIENTEDIARAIIKRMGGK